MKIIKNVLVIAMSLIVLLSMPANYIALSASINGSYGILGTNKALGSPILDSNFVTDDWNRWEMLTWGIFLSNFTIPLIDDYESAFNTNSNKGSKGRGIKALQFGSGANSGSDQQKTISKLVEYASTQQKVGGTKELYVKHTSASKLVGKDSKGGETEYRKATFKDLFLANSGKQGESFLKVGSSGITKVGTSTDKEVLGYSKRHIVSASLPTFAISEGGDYEVVFDYTNGWDAQLLTAWIARLATEDKYQAEFKKTFNKLYEESDKYTLHLDVFGNIVVRDGDRNRVIVPGCVNQHLTNTPKINLVNSMLFNGQTSTLSSEEMVLRGQQGYWEGLLVKDRVADVSGPALASHVSGIDTGMIAFYYDIDSIHKDNSNHYGKLVKELFDIDIRKESGNQYPFKIEAANMSKFDFKGWFDGEVGKVLSNMLDSVGNLADFVKGAENAKVLTKINKNGKWESIFSEPVIVPVRMDNGKSGNRVNSVGASRLFINHLYGIYSGKTSDTIAGRVTTKQLIESQLNSAELSSSKNFAEAVLDNGSGKLGRNLTSFIASNTKLYDITYTDKKNSAMILGAEGVSKSEPFSSLKDVKINGNNIVKVKYAVDGEGKELNNFGQRLIKYYGLNDTMKLIGNILGVKEGTEFLVYSSYIYMTYLDWYGIVGSGDKARHEFNTKIFDGKSDFLNVDIKELGEFKSEEDKVKEVLNYTHLMLDPDNGETYRQQMADSFLNNFIYNWYTKIVYGNADSYYSNDDSVASRNSTGFLTVEPYTENVLTAWFMSMYSKAAIIIVAVSCVLLIVYGVMKARKIGWFLIGIVLIVNVVLILPSVGDITPMVTNKIVQGMFQDKATYWSISESIKNQKLETEYVNGVSTESSFLKGLTTDEKKSVIQTVKSLNVLYLDRTLMVKNDISRKVTQTSAGNYEEIQKLRSARWLLPLIMRQMEGDGGTKDYVYVSLGDYYDDLSNMYWYYMPEDSQYTDTVNSLQDTEKAGESSEGEGNTGSGVSAAVGTKMTESDKYIAFPDYKEIEVTEGNNGEGYKNISRYRGVSTSELPHTYFYLLKNSNGVAPPSRNKMFSGEDFDGVDSYSKYIDLALKSGLSQSYENISLQLERVAGLYDRFDRSTMEQSYGYLWATENPFHYFYMVVKDSFEMDMTLGSIIGKLQGEYAQTEEGLSGNRMTFMHDGDTGNVRDVLDLEEMFTNMIPYLYQMQLVAGGFDTESGVLGDRKIDEYDLYKDNNKAWLFRSNWVSKIMETKAYTRPETIRDSEGNRIEITNPILPESYPANRPMVFSEAQMEAQKLDKSCLSLVELKMVEINEEISRKWTLLLNYVNAEGMTKEVLFRQMATDALVVFNKEMSPTGVTNSAYQLYPSTLDLRSISFDSVVKMIFAGLTKNTSYIYYDNTIKKMLADSDLGTALLLLVTAFVCVFLVSLGKTVVTALIFYLGIFSVLRAFMSSRMNKVKIACGFVVANIIFLVITVAYYLTFSVMMGVTNTDEVLSSQTVHVSLGNPVWVLVVILGMSCLYVYAMYKLIRFCFEHYRDMGFEAYAGMLSAVTDKVRNGIEGIQERFMNFRSGRDSSDVEVGGVDSIGSKVIGSERLDRVVTGDKVETVESRDSNIEKDIDNININLDDRDMSSGNSNEIDKEIERGKKLE